MGAFGASLGTIIGGLVLGGCRMASLAPTDGPKRDGSNFADAILDPANGRPLSQARWVEILGASRWLLLGERHDNPRHHELRARILRQWLRIADRSGARPTIVFEHFDRRFRADLLAAGEVVAAGAVEGARDTELQRMLDAGRFDRRGWEWPLHRPLFEAALEGTRETGARWIAANLSRDEARALRNAPADPALQRRVDEAPWPERAQAALDAEIREGHCNMLPASAVPALARIQRLRDAVMAGALIEAPGRAVLLAGNGHVRRDLGVPIYLGSAANDRVPGGASAGHSLVIGFVEREARPLAGHSMTPDPALAQRYDLVVLTEPAEREDPCLAFRAPAGTSPAGNVPAGNVPLSPAVPGRTPAR